MTVEQVSVPLSGLLFLNKREERIIERIIRFRPLIGVIISKLKDSICSRSYQGHSFRPLIGVIISKRGLLDLELGFEDESFRPLIGVIISKL